jgi:quercetin dioxygenase-like cupin family protein
VQGDAEVHGVRVLTVEDWGPPLSVDDSRAVIRPIVWSGVGARERTLNHFQFDAGGRTPDLCHVGEAVYYVIDGALTATSLDAVEDAVIELGAGGMLHVEPGERYFLQASSAAEVIGGPCPVDDESTAPVGGRARRPTIATPQGSWCPSSRGMHGSWCGSGPARGPRT